MIGIFGGSFNPIHNGHVELARRLLHLAGLDEVWLMVSPQNPLKEQTTLLDDEARLRMVRESVAGEPRLKACDRELVMAKPSYTYLTMRSLSADYYGQRFTLLVGADNWLCFDRWSHHDELLALYSIAVYPRRGYTVDRRSLPPNVIYYDLPLVDISSTDIRRRIRQGQPYAHLMPSPAARIIEREGWYRD